MIKVRWTERAVKDFTGICDYTEKRDGPAAARRLALRIHGDLETLASFPRRGRPGRKSETRELIFTGLPFLAIYRLRDGSIEVLRILHGAQKWP